MPPPSSHPRTNAIESTNQSPLGSEDGATRTKRVKLNFVDKGSASDGSNIATECDSKCYGSQKTCVDGEYEGDLNSSGEREGWGVIKYLGDSSTKGYVLPFLSFASWRFMSHTLIIFLQTGISTKESGKLT